LEDPIAIRKYSEKITNIKNRCSRLRIEMALQQINISAVGVIGNTI
jgi:hypothetical protein